MGERETETATQADATQDATPSPDAAPEPSPAADASASAETAQSEAEAPEVEASEAEVDVIEDIEEPVIELVEAPEVIALREARQELEASQARLRAVSKAYKDLQSEMDSFRIRQQKMAETKLERKIGDVLERFFEPIENLRRAMEAEGDVKEGVAMVLQQFQDRLTALGVREAPGVGEDFDPNVHEALAILPVDDPEQDGKVLHVHTTGYTVNGRAVQAAQVVIGKFEGQVAEA